MSIVPEGKLQLAASGRTSGQLAQEKELDRTKKPAPGQRPEFQAPVVWHDRLENGVNVTGTKYTEVPLTTLSLAVPAGRIYDSLDKLGLSSLTAACMNEGTKALNTLEFTEAAEALGANISVSADEDDFIFTLSVLNKNLKPALELLNGVILTPRFDESDFKRIKKQRMLTIETRADDIAGIASTVWQRLMFGNDSVLGMPANGTKATIEKLTIEDVKNYYSQNISPAGARLTYAGDLDSAGVKELFQQLTSAWRGADRSAAKSAADASVKVKNTQKNVVYLVDKPGAAQSQIRIGHAGVAMSDPNYFPLTVLNYILGGAFSSRINMNLREDKGYTYGARSTFDAGVRDGIFVASGGIHTKHTKAAIVEFIKELKTIAGGVTEAELAFAKNALAQNFALQYESSSARLGMVNNISKYGFKDDYPSRRIAELEKLTVADLKALAEKYIRAGEMQILVVGDKKEVGQGLSELDMGDVTELDIDGEKK